MQAGWAEHTEMHKGEGKGKEMALLKGGRYKTQSSFPIPGVVPVSLPHTPFHKPGARLEHPGEESFPLRTQGVETGA